MTVPQITGRTLSEARSMLSNVGLSYTESYVDSDADYGIVVNCDPGVGKKLEVGSTVTLYISNASQAGGGQEPGDNSGTDTQ